MSHKLDWATLLPGTSDNSVTKIGRVNDRDLYCLYAVQTFTSSDNTFKEITVSTGSVPVDAIMWTTGYASRNPSGSEQRWLFGSTYMSGAGVQFSTTAYNISGQTNIKIGVFTSTSYGVNVKAKIYFTSTPN